MKREKEIISDFEELTKLHTFHEENKTLPYECTYERISHALKEEYCENINEKLTRWANITIAVYFRNVPPVKFYFQAKMLYRDGYYEAAIIMARSLCEMICYELLSNQTHPFGSISDLELENFRTLVNFLAIPKSIDKKVFEEDLIAKISENDDRNFIKSSYTYNKPDKKYNFKVENGKKAETLNKYFRIVEAVFFTSKDNFPKDSYILINKVYDEGNTYVHARKSVRAAKEDAWNSLYDIGRVLFNLFGVDKLPINKTIISGYTDFPDICKGMNFALDVYLTVEDARRGYYNLPSQKQMDKMISVQGKWKGEWRLSGAQNETGLLDFYMEGEYLKANLELKGTVTEHMDIKLFGNYFRLIGFKFNAPSGGSIFDIFDLEWLNDNTLIGTHIRGDATNKTLFTKI